MMIFLFLLTDGKELSIIIVNITPVIFSLLAGVKRVAIFCNHQVIKVRITRNEVLLLPYFLSSFYSFLLCLWISWLNCFMLLQFDLTLPLKITYRVSYSSYWFHFALTYWYFFLWLCFLSNVKVIFLEFFELQLNGTVHVKNFSLLNYIIRNYPVTERIICTVLLISNAVL